MDLSTNAFVTGALVGDNVIPFAHNSSQYVTSPQLGSDPRRIKLSEASGGFNCVFEMSASACLKVIQENLDRNLRYIKGSISVITLRKLISMREIPFDSYYLKQYSPDFPLDLVAILEPVNLSFDNPHEVTITFNASVVVGEIESVALPVSNQPPDISPVIPTISQGLAISNPSASYRLIPEQMLMSNVSELSTSPNTKIMGYFPTNPVSDLVHRLGLERASLTAKSQIIGQSGLNLIELVWYDILGKLTITVSCPYKGVPDLNYKQLDILADLTTSQISIESYADDVGWLYEHSLLESDGWDIGSLIREHAAIHLTPTISLMGDETPKVPVSELTNFDPIVFHLERYRQQAIVAAFNLKPGCKGIIEDVEHFIYNEDYGIISDEYLVASLCLHKWSRRRIPRELELQQTIKVRRNDVVEDATLYGILQLNTLDSVSITANANTRHDGLLLAGGAKAIPEYIVLRDGTSIPHDTDLLDFGPAKTIQWGIFSIFSFHPDFISNPQLRLFVKSVYNVALQYFARPFASSQSVNIVYARTEATSKQVYFLGSFISFSQEIPK